jgi:hypothetical protein
MIVITNNRNNQNKDNNNKNDKSLNRTSHQLLMATATALSPQTDSSKENNSK